MRAGRLFQILQIQMARLAISSTALMFMTGKMTPAKHAAHPSNDCCKAVDQAFTVRAVSARQAFRPAHP